MFQLLLHAYFLRSEVFDPRKKYNNYYYLLFVHNLKLCLKLRMTFNRKMRKSISPFKTMENSTCKKRRRVSVSDKIVMCSHIKHGNMMGCRTPGGGHHLNAISCTPPWCVCLLNNPPNAVFLQGLRLPSTRLLI